MRENEPKNEQTKIRHDKARIKQGHVGRVIKGGRFEKALYVNNLIRPAYGEVSIRNLTTKGAKDKY